MVRISHIHVLTHQTLTLPIVTQQLNDGIRMLQMQAHLENNDIHLCHTSCILLDGGTLQDYLSKGTVMPAARQQTMMYDLSD